MKTDGYDDKRIRYFIGSVRDQEGLRRTFMAWTWKPHAADLKQVPDREYITPGGKDFAMYYYIYESSYNLDRDGACADVNNTSIGGLK